MQYRFFIALFLTVFAFNGIKAELIPPTVNSNIEVAGIKLKLSNKLRDEIQVEVNRIMRSESFFRAKVDLANLYLPIVEEVFKKEQVPTDLMYLCIQESGLVSDAVSSSKAVGFWQFKYATGKEVGMRIDKFVDERLNIYASSVGAAKYFKRNNFRFKNWIYAVLAHNTGPGGAQQHVKKEYFGAEKMSVDHKLFWYVRRFIAHKIAYEAYVTGNHTKGLRLLEYKNGAGKTLSQISKSFQVEIETLSAYNKWLRRGAVPDDKTYTVLIPTKSKRLKPQLAEKSKGKKSTASSSKSGIPKVLQEKNGEPHVFIKLNKIRSVIAKSTDNFNTIAKTSDVPVPYLMRFNDLSDDDNIVPGHVYYLKSKKGKAKISYHQVQEGDSFWSISQRYGIKLKKLKKFNRVTSNDKEPAVGQQLWMRKKRPADDILEFRAKGNIILQKPIEKLKPLARSKPKAPSVVPEDSDKFTIFQRGIDPTKTVPDVPAKKVEENSPEVISQEIKVTTEEAPQENTKLHYIEKGETLYAISRRFNVDVETLYVLNDFQGGEIFNIGQSIILPDSAIDSGKQTIDFNTGLPDGNPSATKKTDATKHLVTQGESLWAIAQKYNISLDTLKQINGLSSNDVDQGQLLTIPSSPNINSKDSKPDLHIVKQGESLWSIAQQYNTTIDHLRLENQLTSDDLSEGQELVITKSDEKPSQQTIMKPGNIHVVQKGESLWSISKQYDITINLLKKINGMSDTNVNVGDSLQLASDQMPEGDSKEKIEDIPSNVTSHEVQPGDTFYSIAKKYGVSVKKLQQVNNKEDLSLVVGEKIILSE